MSRPSPGTVPSHGISFQLVKHSSTRLNVTSSNALDEVEWSQSEALIHNLSFRVAISRLLRRCSIQSGYQSSGSPGRQIDRAPDSHLSSNPFLSEEMCTNEASKSGRR